MVRTRWAAGAAVMVCLMLGGRPALAQYASPASPAPPVRDPMPSAGCGTSTVAPGTTTASMNVDGLERSWSLHVPPAHDGLTPLPLVIVLHGYSMHAADMSFSGLGPLGDEMGFVTVTPEGRGSIQRWIFELDDRGWDVIPSNPDIVFIGALIDRLGAELCLDLARVFSTGFANGAMASSALACTIGERIAAVAPVTGIMDFGDRCATSRPVPVMAFHGTADPIVLLDGGFGPMLATFPTDVGGTFTDLPMVKDPANAVPIAERAAGIAQRYGCTSEASTSAIAEHAQRIAYTCPAGADVVLILAQGAGHAWPGNTVSPDVAKIFGPGTLEIDASRLMWGFFVQHPLPAE